MLRALAAAAVVALSPPSAALAARPAKPAASPVEVTRAFYTALHAGDVAAAAKLAHGDARPVIDAFVRNARAHRQLEAALASRFGRDAAGLVGYGNRVQSEVKALLGAAEEIAGDEAQVSTLDGRTLANLRRVRGAWKIEIDEEVLTPEGRARVGREARAAEAAAKGVVAGLRSGRYADADAAVRDFRRRAGLPEPPGAEEHRPSGDGGVDL